MILPEMVGGGGGGDSLSTSSPPTTHHPRSDLYPRSGFRLRRASTDIEEIAGINSELAPTVSIPENDRLELGAC